MCSKYGWVIKGGQKYFATDHEKGSRDQNREAQKLSEDPSPQVGYQHNVRKGEGDRAGGMPARSFWFDDPQAKEIGASPGSQGTVDGWVYVRTKTGHLKKRTNR